MTIRKTMIVALGGAAAIEALLWIVFLLFSHFGGDGPDSIGALFLYFHIAGFTIADKVLRLSSPMDAVCVAGTGLVQSFMALWLVLVAVSVMTRKTIAEPPSPGDVANAPKVKVNARTP